MNDNLNLVRSRLPHMAWPMLPDNAGALALAVQFQLEQTQWWPPAELEQRQMQQLQLLLRHAHDMPFWRERLDMAGFSPGQELTAEMFRSLPVMTRADIQAHGDALLSRDVPRDHGTVTKGETSGSTGRPITYYGTELTQFFWRACTLRDHLWHRRDFSGKLAAIRTAVEQRVTQGWGGATDTVFDTGPLATLDIRSDIDTQLAWLRAEDPDYLLSFASNLRMVAANASARGIRLPKLREVRTFGEALPDDLRDLCRRAWNVPVVDIYSAQEVGYIALQCPSHEHYHVQAESLIVEILDDHGAPCAPGRVGRVVVTTLHNFAMPLIRYELGDFAEAGAACACGRGLPVIRRIMGRWRNFLTLPDGRRHWPSYPSEKWAQAAPVTQLQMVQKSRDSIVVRVVAPQNLEPDERRKLIEALQSCLGYPFNMDIEQVSAIPRGKGFKFEEFMSEINA